jgi:hypothetical protein
MNFIDRVRVCQAPLRAPLSLWQVFQHEKVEHLDNRVEDPSGQAVMTVQEGEGAIGDPLPAW